MEFKVIIYIIIGVVYFIYTMMNKAKEENQQNPTPTRKPVQPPAGNPFDDITREIKRRQAEATAKRQQPKPQPKPLRTQQPVKKKEVLVTERPTTFAGEGTNYEPTYERELTDEEKIVRGNLKIENEGVYKMEAVETLAELDKREKEEATRKPYGFNAREAFIGSLIFERKF